MTQPTPKELRAALAAQKLADAMSRGKDIRTFYNYRKQGAPGFRPDGTVEDWPALDAWVEANAEALSGATRGIEAERDQKIRKLKLANDKSEGRLIERAVVAERMQRAAGDLNSFRAKSEAEHPMRFAAAAGDPAKCREVLRAVWDEIFASINQLSKHFSEEKKP